MIPDDTGVSRVAWLSGDGKDGLGYSAKHAASQRVPDVLDSTSMIGWRLAMQADFLSERLQENTRWVFARAEMIVISMSTKQP